MKCLSLMIALLFLAISGCNSGNKKFNIPENPGNLVSDYAKILKQEEINQLETKLNSINQKESIKCVIVTIPTLNGETIEEFSIKLAEKWKIGTKKDDGMILILAPNEKKSRIEVGYGLEARFIDSTVTRWQTDNKQIFKDKKWAAGLDAIISNISPANGIGSVKVAKTQSIWELLIAIVFILIVIFILVALGVDPGMIALIINIISSSKSGGSKSNGGSSGSFGGGGGSSSWD